MRHAFEQLLPEMIQALVALVVLASQLPDLLQGEQPPAWSDLIIWLMIALMAMGIGFLALPSTQLCHRFHLTEASLGRLVVRWAEMARAAVRHWMMLHAEFLSPYAQSWAAIRCVWPTAESQSESSWTVVTLNTLGAPPPWRTVGA